MTKPREFPTPWRVVTIAGDTSPIILAANDKLPLFRPFWPDMSVIDRIRLLERIVAAVNAAEGKDE